VLHRGDARGLFIRTRCKTGAEGRPAHEALLFGCPARPAACPPYTHTHTQPAGLHSKRTPAQPPALLVNMSNLDFPLTCTRLTNCWKSALILLRLSLSRCSSSSSSGSCIARRDPSSVWTTSITCPRKRQSGDVTGHHRDLGPQGRRGVGLSSWKPTWRCASNKGWSRTADAGNSVTVVRAGGTR
jgi:hypothetical protein